MDGLIMFQNEVVSFLMKNGLKATFLKEIDYGVQLSVENQTFICTLNLYLGKKGRNFAVGCNNPTQKIAIVNLMERFLGNESSTEVSVSPIEHIPSVSAEIIVSSPSLLVRPFGFEEEEDFDFCWIGNDESGKGDFFGSLVIASVFVDENSSDTLLKLGVMDSKKLNDVQIKKLAAEIKIICKGKYSILEFTPSIYNSVYDEIAKANKRLNHLLAWGHAKSLEETLRKCPDCGYALIDQFGSERYVESCLKEKGSQITVIQRPKAEKNIAVAAASILAREKFVTTMEDLSDKYKMEIPKGASTKVIRAGREFVAKYGKDELKNVCKMHFGTLEPVLNLDIEI